MTSWSDLLQQHRGRHAPPAPTAREDPADWGLHCPYCQYNLTGLTSARCPECGRPVDWEHARREAENPPRIAFERQRGLRTPLGWLLTWLTVLFAPWLFARQIVQRVSLRHATVFAAVCFAGTCTAVLLDATWDVYLAWLITAAVYILLQALGLTILDFAHWRRPRASVRFWLAVGGYTSAVMVTEITGPPMIVLNDLQLLLGMRGIGANYVIYSELYAASWAAAIAWTQIGLWLIAIVCCYAARLRAAGIGWRRRLPASLAVLLLSLIGYATAVQWIGYHLLAWMGL